MTPPKKAMAPTLAALGGLLAGFTLGIVFHGSTDPWVVHGIAFAGTIGQLWVSAIRMAALPLVVVLTLGGVEESLERLAYHERREL